MARSRSIDDTDDGTPRTLRGTVARLIGDKGFGFITGADGLEYFFHRSAAPDFDALTEGEAVRFTPTQGAKGLRAESVVTV
jgi:CspA family cold shock protein